MCRRPASTASQRVLAAAREFTQPQVGSSASTIIIFLPLAFLSGITGAFFKALSLTMAVSLFISFLVAWLVVPAAGGFHARPQGYRARKNRPLRALVSIEATPGSWFG